VYLPATGEDTGCEGSLDHVTTSVPWQGSGTILLVEDDDQVRFIAKTILVKFGFTVVEAINGKEALEKYQEDSAHISLVLTDIGMPLMDGYELFFELKKLNPGLPIIISSGFGDRAITSRIPEEDMAGLISKPYNPLKLRELLKSILEGRRAKQA
jgi:CheY-like chemotaxis protein